MSHSHRGSRPHLPPDPPTISSQPEPVTEHHNPYAKFGFDKLDPKVLDMFLGIVALSMDKDMDAVSVGIELVKESTVYTKVLDLVARKCGGDKDQEKRMMFVLAMFTGASCMLQAVDDGLVVDTTGGDNDEDEEGD